MYKELLQLRQSNHNTWCYIYMVEVLHSANVENIWKTDLNVDALENFKSGLKIYFKINILNIGEMKHREAPHIANPFAIRLRRVNRFSTRKKSITSATSVSRMIKI